MLPLYFNKGMNNVIVQTTTYTRCLSITQQKRHLLYKKSPFMLILHDLRFEFYLKECKLEPDKIKWLRGYALYTYVYISVSIRNTLDTIQRSSFLINLYKCGMISSTIFLSLYYYYCLVSLAWSPGICSSNLQGRRYHIGCYMH